MVPNTKNTFLPFEEVIDLTEFHFLMFFKACFSFQFQSPKPAKMSGRHIISTYPSHTHSKKQTFSLPFTHMLHNTFNKKIISPIAVKFNAVYLATNNNNTGSTTSFIMKSSVNLLTLIEYRGGVKASAGFTFCEKIRLKFSICILVSAFTFLCVSVAISNLLKKLRSKESEKPVSRKAANE